MRGVGLALALAASLLGVAPDAAAESGSRVRGQVRLDLPGTQLADAGPVVVYLDGLDGPPRHAAAATGVATVHQRDARFSPSFLAVAAGQSVDMPNDDAIYHNVFSYSRPNDFDLGLYPSGESRRVTLKHPGVVKTYCSIHESMSGTIFVAPSPWFAVAASDGRFEIRGVPPGRYRLRTWCERLPDSERTIEVTAQGDLELDLPLLP